MPETVEPLMKLCHHNFSVAADALQLAAAFIAAERRPASLQVVTLDQRLAEAMRKEGFALVDIAAD